MVNTSFIENLGHTIDATLIASKNNLSYLSAATAMQLAGRPTVEFVEFDNKPYLPLFDGAVVAVDLAVQQDIEGAGIQRTWLPVMDRDNRCMPLDKVTVNDINNSRQRCLVKAIASVYGHGMSIFLGTDGDGKQAVKVLGLTPESDLATAEPVLDKLPGGGELYLGWNFALAAARTVDPTFYWEVVCWEGKPYREVLGGIIIDIDTFYRGKRQRLSLPMMDEAFNPVSASKASVWMWNRTVMRALAKAIAFSTGYGLQVYANEFGGLVEGSGMKESPRSKAKTKEPEQLAVSEVPAVEPASQVQSTPSMGSQAPESEVVGTEAASEAPEAKAGSKEKAKTSKPSKPDAEASEVVTPEPTLVKAEAAPPAVDQENAETRFRGVMKKRAASNGLTGLIDLFEAIHISKKYSEDEKPVCFGLLVSGLASMLNEEGDFDPVNLLENIAAYNAMTYVPADTLDLIRVKLVSVCLEKALSQSDEALERMPELIKKAGLANDLDETIGLAKKGGVPKETMEFLMALI